MLGLMQNKQKKYSGKKPGLGILIIVTVMVLGYVFDSGTDFHALLPVLIIAGAFMVVLLFTGMLMKTQNSLAAKPDAKPTAVRKPNPGGYTGAEEAIRCAHRSGKEKYLEQIESFLSNGIIDKAEYRLLKERYEKLDLPDDYH